VIKVKSPTRVDLAGGTLDMWPLYNFVKNATTINVAVDIFTEVELEFSGSKLIKIESADLDKVWTFESWDQFFTSFDSSLQLYQTVIQFFWTQRQSKFESGISMRTRSESPIGGGLGGSSSLIVSMLRAFSQLLDYNFSDTHHLVQIAHNLEAQILFTPTGTQDYYPAVCGGLNILNYSATGISQRVYPVNNSEIFENFLLVYTGRSHHSGLNNFEVLKLSVERDNNVLEALAKINSIAELLKEAIINNDLKTFPVLMQQEYEARIRLTPSFSSPEIERLAKIAKSNGADAIKICGAGGGGCVLIWVHPSHRQKVIKACENENFQCLKTKPFNPI
jgi:D-glycero-alpha-D-manno-heptose-7-phosphate kinase